MQVRVLTWNLYHGRDGPPDPALYTRRAEWTRETQRNATHVQVNRNLYREFSRMLCAAEWDVALLQESPPRWAKPLGADCGAERQRALTSRNWALPLTSFLARLNPDLVGSAEGGSNLILARGRAGGIVERRKATIHRLRPERRAMAFARLGCGLCVTSLHASTHSPVAEQDILTAASRATELAAGSPLILGGDFNVRAHSSDVYEKLSRRFELEGNTGPDSIDQLLLRGASFAEPPTAWPAERRELREDGLALRLSDHAPVTATIEL
ncbi:MAG: endonuclease/exonuclease/phosphatase family protein [Solirubrobacterales bacterium]|nr:endonuclease/exonuclease/phosphatase family protein [Solirubrobacterales bacterium]